jgi:hypothetical protein
MATCSRLTNLLKMPWLPCHVFAAGEPSSVLLVRLAAPDDKGGSDMHDEPRSNLKHTNHSGDAQ